MFWMITNRNVDSNAKPLDVILLPCPFGKTLPTKSDIFDNWTSMNEEAFRQGLVAIANTFPDPNQTPSEDQKHLNLFVHGFDTDWLSAVRRYGAIVNNLFSGPQSLESAYYSPGHPRDRLWNIFPTGRKRANPPMTSPTCSAPFMTG
jgi:hypothetical protein